MQTGHDYLLVEHKVASEWGGDSGCWPTHIGTFASTAQQVTFSQASIILCPLVPHGFIFPNILGVFGFGDFFGFLGGVN